MRRSYGDRTTTNLVALEMLEQGSSSPAPRPAPQSTASSFEEENEENRPPPTLLQRRKMDPLSPIAFNFGAPHCGAIGKTYIKIRPRSLSPLKKSVGEAGVNQEDATALVVVQEGGHSAAGPEHSLLPVCVPHPRDAWKDRRLQLVLRVERRQGPRAGRRGGRDAGMLLDHRC